MFSVYLGIHVSKIKPYYEDYIIELQLKRKYLLVTDIARLDKVPVKYVCEVMGIKTGFDCDFIP